MVRKQVVDRAGQTGGSGSDVFAVSLSEGASSSFSGGTGTDTLRILDRGGYRLGPGTFGNLSGIDVLDLSAHRHGTLDLRLSRGLLDQSDDRRVTIVSGKAGIDRLDASKSLKGSVILDGRGLVELSSSSSNRVEIADGARIEVIGGARNDHIIAGDRGARIGGGRGDDLIVAGEGADIIGFGLGDGRDRIAGFDPLADRLTLKGVAASSMDDLLALMRESSGSTVITFADGSRVTLLGVGIAELDHHNFRIAGIEVAPANRAPVAADARADVLATEDEPFTWSLPKGAFTDADGDALALSAVRADGATLPDWLSFDAATGALSGTPLEGVDGRYEIVVTAMDGRGAVAALALTLTVAAVNDAPILNLPLADAVAAWGAPITIELPAGSFGDADDHTLALTARLANGGALPAWLSFDAGAGRFSGTPARADEGALTIEVTASDGHGAVASDRFALAIEAPVLHIAPGASASEINAAIRSAGPGSIVQLDAGIHTLEATVLIDRGDVTLRGAPGGGTVLAFDLPADTPGPGIAVRGGEKALAGVLIADADAGATELVLASGHGLVAGDHVHVAEPNTEKYLAENGWSNVAWSDAADKPFREFIAEIVAVEGDRIVLGDPLPYAMAAGVTQVSTIDLLEDVAVRDLSLTFAFGAPDPDNFINTIPAYLGLAAFLVDGAASLDLERIAVTDAASHGFDLRSIIHLQASDLRVEGAHNKGPDGNGYGVQLYEAFNNVLEGLQILDVRHALLLSSWNAETGNSVSIAGTNRDINFHGSPDHGNTIIVEHGVLTYDPTHNAGTEDGIWPVVGPGGSMHANIDPYAANTILFHHAGGHDDADHIIAAPGGAFLSGGGNRDTLEGGNGGDTITGGLGRDLMSGAAGADLFLLRPGDNYDTITDFEPGVDRLVIIEHDAVAAFARLELIDSAEGLTVRYGLSGTVTLEGVTVAMLSVGDVLFAPDGFASTMLA